MPRILICDTYYGDFLRTFQVNAKSTYEAELRRLLDCQFGTADFYSRNLRKLGWEAADFIANCPGLLEKYWHENRLNDSAILNHYIQSFDPEVVFFQDLSLVRDATLNLDGRIIAGQCSCSWPGDHVVEKFDVIYTSFPHYVPRIEKLNVRAVYNPLAFEPSVLEDQFTEFEAAYPNREIRPHDCVFIGGVGNPSHWKYGMEVLETVARDIGDFQWWGYGIETLPTNSFLCEGQYRGPAFGRDMYEILLRSKICLNRHGEVAEGYSNNMRMFEATGCGALLLTEDSKNIRDFFTEKECVTYSSPQDAVDKIRYYLEKDEERQEIALNGQRRTLLDHTYTIRMKKVSETLTELLGRKSPAGEVYANSNAS